MYAGTESGDVLKFKVYDAAAGVKCASVAVAPDLGTVSTISRNRSNPGGKASSSQRTDQKLSDERLVGDALFLGSLAPRKGARQEEPIRDPFKKGERYDKFYQKPLEYVLPRNYFLNQLVLR